MKSWKMRGVAALAVISLAIAGCQNQGSDESVDGLESMPMESMGTESMGTESMGTESMDASMEASPSDDS